MTDIIIPRPKLIRPNSLWVPGEAMEEFFPGFDLDVRKLFEKILVKPLRDRFAVMTGSLSNNGSKKVADAMFGATAFTGVTPIYFGLWAAALDDTSTGSTGSESAYGSYARLGLTNNTTIFAAGTGTSIYTKTFPSDAAKSFVTSTATGTNNTITYLGILDALTVGNTYAWCSVTSTTINSGDTPQLAQNAITLTQD